MIHPRIIKQAIAKRKALDKKGDTRPVLIQSWAPSNFDYRVTLVDRDEWDAPIVYEIPTGCYGMQKRLPF